MHRLRWNAFAQPAAPRHRHKLGERLKSGALPRMLPQGVVTLGTIGQMALFFSAKKCQH
jgi:hypothetical protein